MVVSCNYLYATDAVLKWDASTGDVSGYIIYYGLSQGSYPFSEDVENVTQYSLNDFSLTEGTTYYFVVRAYNASGESGDSNITTYTVPSSGDTTPPIPPEGISGAVVNDGILLQWQANSETDFSEYWVYYGTASRNYGLPISVSGTEYSLTGLETDVTYYISVSAVDTSGNESGYSSPEVAVMYTLPDTTAPVLTVTSPTWGENYSIDSDNNIIYKGAKFFPVISFGRHITTLREWAEKSRINIAGGVSWNGSGIDYYRQYLDTVEAAGLSCIGPMHDTRFDGEGEPKWTINDIEEYILTLRDHPANACWMWREEPDNWGYDAQSQKDWWDKGKELDPSRPTEILFMAFQYFYNDQNFLTWSGGTSAGLRMKLKTYHWPYLTGDIYSADWYPIEHPERPYTLFSQAIDRAYMWNMDLIPVFPNVQSCDVTHGDADVEPTVQELKNMCWLAIVHKAKGIHWYPWAPTPEINYEYMSEFVENVTELTEVILGDEPTRNVEYSTSDNVRVDIMVKEYLDETWIIAVNTSRTRATQVTFDVESLMNRSKIEVFKEDSIVSGNGSFRDVFMPMDVHIYKITDEYIPVDPDTELEIDNIYPNPFSTSTTISFSTPESGVFYIGIYSILGQKIKHIFNGELPAGHSEFYWNGNSDSGGRVSKGTYIIKVFSGRKNIIGKIVSLK